MHKPEIVNAQLITVQARMTGSQETPSVSPG